MLRIFIWYQTRPWYIQTAIILGALWLAFVSAAVVIHAAN